MISPRTSLPRTSKRFVIEQAPAGSPGRSQRFTVQRLPRHRLPGWLVQPEGPLFQELDKAWATDYRKRISTRWSADKIQLAFSTTPSVSPTPFVARAKGRLQHALRLAGTPVKFSRKVSFRSIGDNHSADVEFYIAQQVDK